MCVGCNTTFRAGGFERLCNAMHFGICARRHVVKCVGMAGGARWHADTHRRRKERLKNDARHNFSAGLRVKRSLNTHTHARVRMHAFACMAARMCACVYACMHACTHSRARTPDHTHVSEQDGMLVCGNTELVGEGMPPVERYVCRLVYRQLY